MKLDSQPADSLRRNAASVAVIQAANMLLPLILTPYLTRVLGLDLYGVVAYGIAMVQVSSVVTDYGFSVSAPHRISTNRDNRELIRSTIGSVFVGKLILVVLTYGAYALAILAQPDYAQHAGFLLVLGTASIFLAFQPTWFFQGIERMRFITYYTLAARLGYVVATLALVHSGADYGWIGVTYSLSFLMSTAIALSLMVRLGYTPRWAGWSATLKLFREATPFFWSRAAVALYSSGATVFVGAFSTHAQVGYYGLANQVYRSAGALQSSMVMAFFPYMARTKDFPRLFGAIRRAVVLYVVAWVAGLALVPLLVPMVFGADFDGAVEPMLILLAAFVVTVPSTYLGYPALGALNRLDLANRSVWIAGVAQLCLLGALALTGRTTAVWVALSVLVVEALVLLLRSRWVRRVLAAQEG